MIKLKEIIAGSGRRPKDIAAEVFPDHRNPMRTLTRLMSGRQPLTVDDMIRICRSCGVSAADTVAKWSVGSEGTLIVLSRGVIKAEIASKCDKVRVYRGGVLIYDGKSQGLLSEATLAEVENVLNRFTNLK